MQTKNRLFRLILKGVFPIHKGMKYFLLLLPLLLLSAPAHANRTVMSPYVSEGVAYVESKSGYVIDDDAQVSGAWKQVFGLGYGITDYWATEVELGFGRSGVRGADVETETLEWQHKFQFAPKGEWLVDMGGRVSYVYSTNAGQDRINGVLAAAKSFGPLDVTTNGTFSRQVGDGASNDTSYGIATGVSYAVSDNFKPGIEMYNDFGGGVDPRHAIGPIAYGKMLGDIGYNAGVLFGVNDDAPDATLKFVIDYKFGF